MGVARDVQKALAKALRERPTLTEITTHIGDGDGLTQPLRKEIVFTGYTSTATYRVMADGVKPTDSEGSLTLEVNAREPGQEVDEAVDECERMIDEIRAVIAEAMADTPNVLDVDGLHHLIVARDQTGWHPQTEGWAGSGQVTVEFRAQ